MTDDTQPLDATLDEAKLIQGWRFVKKLPGGYKLVARSQKKGGMKVLKVEAIIDLGEVAIEE